MKAMPVKRIDTVWVECSVNEATHVKLKFPLSFEPLQYRYIPVQLSGIRNGTSNWTWNGDINNPTLKPSILTEFLWGKERTNHRCHSFINDGKVQFLNDCTHVCVGQTLDLLDVI